MNWNKARGAYAFALLIMAVCGLQPVAAQHDDHMKAVADSAHDAGMTELSLGRGWRALGMAQVFPIVTTGFGADAVDRVTDTELYATQPAVMFNVESPGSRFVLRTTLNFEGVTQPDGELTFGGWGEGFIDRRHPHTLLHEAMLSVNFDDVGGGALSVSAGKGFAPYGTDDPMSRPVAKYPTNHHLSQVLERYLVSVAWLRSGLSVEAGIFDGTEPMGAYDFDNFRHFPNSWSARLTGRFGGVQAPWELSVSYAHVVEVHHDEDRPTRLVNAYARHDAAYGFGRLYALVEASRSDPDEGDGYFAIVGETQLTRGRHQPYARVELATRPEYAREAADGDGFFRYDHDAHAVGATRWVITSLGYGFTATQLPFSLRPFVEVQYHNAANERGDVAASELFGTNDFFSLTAGARVFLGGGPMRMGSYGVLDAITAHGRAMHAGH
jgi:hypothetical protein